MLINDSKEILLCPEKLLEGTYSTSELKHLFYGLFCEYVDLSQRDKSSQLRLDIVDHLPSLIAIAISDLMVTPNDLVAVNQLNINKVTEVGNRCKQAKTHVKQVLMLGNFEEKLAQPDRTLVVFYQYIPEIFQALTCHSIFDLQQQFQKSINACVMTAFNADHQKNTLTDANTGTKVAWYLGEMLLKVALNAVSMSLGGALIDSLHSALNTHGASIFELNKQKVSICDSTGSQGNVFVRRDTDWQRRASSKEILFQVISDIGDEAYKDAESAAKTSVKQRFASYFQESINGTPITTLEKSNGFSLLMIPIEILLQRLKSTETLIRRVILEVMEKTINSGGSLQSLETLKVIALEVKKQLSELQIHAYLTYLMHLANQMVEVYQPKTLYKVLMAETLVSNGDQLLQSNQVLSSGLWQLLYRNGLAAKGVMPEDKKNDQKTFQQALSTFSPLPTEAGCQWGAKYKEAYQDSHFMRLEWYFQTAYHNGLLTVSANEKFGNKSSLATLARSKQLLTLLKQEVGDIIKALQDRSDYISFTKQVGVSQLAGQYWSRIKEDVDFNISF